VQTPPITTFEPGTRLGKYTLVAPLGRGGMGGVWGVEDDTGKKVALKSPASGRKPAAQTTKRFARDGQAGRMLAHPNLVAAIDVFVESGYLFLVMERVYGVTLAKTLLKGPLAARRALVVTRQLLDGVGHAHGHGLVHRDLKPDNIMLVDKGG